MKRIFLAAACTLLGMAAFAQDQAAPAATANTQTRMEARRQHMREATPDNIADMKTSRLDKTVTLTDDQKAKVRAIYLKQAQANQGRAQFNKATQEEIRAVLTDQQNQALEAARKEKMEQIRQRRANISRGNPKPAPALTPESSEQH